MVVFSSLIRLSPNITNKVLFRKMSGHHNTFVIQPSRYQWKKFKDMFHLYAMVGAIPCGLVLLYANVFIGPATLTEIPEGYEPKHWEYSRHPVTRFIARYVIPSPQEDYEKYLAFMYLESEKTKLRKLEAEIEKKMSERNDYQVYYYRPFVAKYPRLIKEKAEELKKLDGD